MNNFIFAIALLICAGLLVSLTTGTAQIAAIIALVLVVVGMAVTYAPLRA
jgi:hypothetical protein